MTAKKPLAPRVTNAPQFTILAALRFYINFASYWFFGYKTNSQLRDS